MSSRTAAARKRIVSGEEKRPTSSKGFFSRSKTPKSIPPMHSERSYSPTPHLHANAPRTPTNTNSSNGVKLNSLPVEDSSDYSQQRQMERALKKATSGPLFESRGVKAYPSPPREEILSSHTMRFNHSSPHINTTSSYQIRVEGNTASGPAFLEASYQPPPPSRAIVQLHPPTSYSPVPSLNFEALSTFTPPPHYPPPVPSSPRTAHYALPPPSVSPLQNSLLLQSASRGQSPTPTELPTYSNSQSLYLSPQINQQISTQNSASSHQYLTPSYQPPPSPSRHTPSPLNLQISSIENLNSQLAALEEDRRPWNRHLSGNGSPGPSSPTSFSSRTSPKLRPRGSFASGSSSSIPVSLEESTPNAFIFPGSRSMARPKVSKTGDPQFKFKGRGKASRREDLLDMPTTPQKENAGIAAASPAMASRMLPASSDYEPPRIVLPRTPTGMSETASIRSDDSSFSSRDRRLSNTSLDPGPTGAAFVFPSSRSRAAPRKPPPKYRDKSLSHKHSGNTSEGSSDREESKRVRFMGIPLKKKKKDKDIGFSTSGKGENLTPLDVHGVNAIPTQNPEQVRRIKSRIGNYPLDPYDSILLDNDRHTGELLARLNPTSSPSFHNYGNAPPASVLDLGCGQGHWVVDAAIAWKGYGTNVTGYDMVDITKTLSPWAAEQGVSGNIRFVRGNFLKQRLPFSDNSFDLVRMSCLALCITSDSWAFVLQEVCRVLMVGGRLELIDDLIFFPYGKTHSMMEGSDIELPLPRQSVAPVLDITIPSSRFTTFSIYDSDTTNPGLGLSVESLHPQEPYELYGVEEEADLDDAATINGDKARSFNDDLPRPIATPRIREDITSGIGSQSWNRAYGTSQDLEALFEHMLTHKFGIHKDPTDFILELMKEIFGHAQEVKTMHITLAPPDQGADGSDEAFGPKSTNERRVRGRSFAPASNSRRQSMGLSEVPGLVLWPSTFIPMDRSEIEIHASKHLRLLISSKKYLLEHAVEATDDDEIDEDSVMEALWEYEGFLRHRFDPPTSSSVASDQVSQVSSDSASIRDSIAESVSSDNREALLEIQSEFGQHYVWSPDTFISSDRPATPGTPQVQDNTPTGSTISLANPPSALLHTAPARQDRSASPAPSITPSPLYSREELTHVRTFRIYEAIKVDNAILGAAV